MCIHCEVMNDQKRRGTQPIVTVVVVEEIPCNQYLVFGARSVGAAISRCIHCCKEFSHLSLCVGF